MQSVRIFSACFLFSLSLFVESVSADSQKVMVSIKPLALLYLALQPEGEQLPEILLAENQNLHDFSLTVQQLESVKSADVLLWLGPKTEPYLGKLQDRFGTNGWVALNDRMHAWLEEPQILILTQSMVSQLKTAQPEQAQAIDARHDAFTKALQSNLSVWRARFEPWSQTPYLIGHSAFENFARYLGLDGAVEYSAGHSHGQAPSGMHSLLQVQQRISDGKIQCAVEEPDVSFKRLKQRFPALRTVQLSPMAAGVALNANGFLTFVDQSAALLYQCLAGQPWKDA